MKSRTVESSMDIQDEAWVAIPGLDGYEVSTTARVRSFRAMGRGSSMAVEPHVLDGMHWKGERFYTLDGDKHSIDSIMRRAFGETDEWDEIDFETDAINRDLSQYEVNEIRMAEGYKPAYQVAEEFRIDSGRVRSIWDGTE